MAVLPAAATPVTLDALLTRAKAVAAVPSPRRPRSHLSAATPSHAPISDDNTPLLSDLLPRDAIASVERPVALVLTVQILRCACGEVYHAPATYALAKYAPNAHSFRYSRADLADCAALPREVRRIDARIPFCEKCF